MPAVVTTPPEPIVTLDEAKAQVRFAAADDDEYLSGLIAAATAYLDGPDGILGRAIGPQTIKETRRAFPTGWADTWEGIPDHCRDADYFRVECRPIISLVSLTYIDQTGTPQAIDVSTLAFDQIKIEEPDGGWPYAKLRLGSVTLTYQAGYEVTPPALKHAVLLMVGTLYANREATPETAFTGAVEALISNFARVA